MTSAPFFATVYVEERTTVLARGSDGDLWPSCWAHDDAVYAANGDGRGFGWRPRWLGGESDIALSRITGTPFQPSTLRGRTIARGDALGQVWTPGHFTRKPTGMLARGGVLHLAVQDLSRDFMEAPAATIASSRDRGRTWSWDRTRPMFDDHVMTTLMFLDFGKDSAHAIDEFVYVYALDRNWRFSTRVASPTELWLARVPAGHVQDRSAWTYFAGIGPDGSPRFVRDVRQRVPVLESPRNVYTRPLDPTLFGRDAPVLSQGGVLYLAPFRRYLYTSWTEYTLELFDAPAPWGPWRELFSRDFGGYPWTLEHHGGYGASVPSKFVAPDGRTLHLHSSTFAGGIRRYGLAFRKLYLEPFAPSPPGRIPHGDLAREPGATPIARAARGESLRDLLAAGASPLDSFTGEVKSADWWGVTWPYALSMNALVYTAGPASDDGGWFSDVRVEVRRDGVWAPVPAVVEPRYPASAAADNRRFELTFDPVVADGVRIAGTPGGRRSYTTARRLEVFLRAR